MRRSKSDPAKYAKNYRSISQRRMTTFDGMDEAEEMNRLRAMLRESEAHLKSATTTESPSTSSSSQQQSRKRPRKVEPDQVQANQTKQNDKHGPVNLENPVPGILSAEILEEMKGDDNNIENPLMIVGSKKKKKTTTDRLSSIQLTPQEIRRAKQMHKKTEKKLQQLQTRAAMKKKRTELYAKLESSSLTEDQRNLLSSSRSLGKKMSKKEILQKALRKERAGIALTVEEKDLLYTDRVLPDDVDGDKVKTQENETIVTCEPKDSKKRKGVVVENGAKKKTSSSAKHEGDDTRWESCNDSDSDDHHDATGDGNADGEEETASQDSNRVKEETKEKDAGIENESKNGSATPPTKSLAAQMMASLAQLKTVSSQQAERNAKKREEEEMKRKREEESKKKPVVKYIPTEPAVLKTAATLGIKSNNTLRSTKKVRTLNRPADVQALRLELPVTAMEFEIMDAIQSNDVTILCAETGSGKSTQVPQFLYEAGLSSSANESESPSLIGITQPRRVAAVSTAKRVCFEMGHGDGQEIRGSNRGKGNLVSYQTRYESAGLGSSTHVKFMTDGILLQEIQSDLLLRKYSVIVLDEAHERNLNTDVLIGLLSATVRLRKQAAAEEATTLKPLKIIIMSATLRVSDFTGNKDLFAQSEPAVVKIPGRTYPVTIHHSKVTELDNYEEVAFRKTCKIHRKLPQGGILLFLTGKQEIVRMVKRLRRSLGSKKDKETKFNSSFLDVAENSEDTNIQDGPRDMDDDEVDGDIFQTDTVDEDQNREAEEDEATDADVDTDGLPQNAIILPLYSMMPADEQAKIFAPVPEGYRLIVVATNIAETSITIPGISYVVDSGRQKCRNYNAGTGVASYDIMWISRAAADQRAGRAGRTGPGHCYRLYSSSMYSRHMDAFALPEVLTRPLEDVVLAMKAMKIANIGSFPFPTPPDKSQLDAALRLLAHIGCVDLSRVEREGGDGEATRLGLSVSKLPLGVRYGKMLLVAAQAGVLDYAIVVVAAMSEQSPFLRHGQSQVDDIENDEGNDDDDDDEGTSDKVIPERKNKGVHRWTHKAGDIIATMLAVGAYTYAGRSAGGAAERLAYKRFCAANGLNPVVMDRIQKMRQHLARLSKARLGGAEGIAAKTGGILSAMKPPSKVEEHLLCQSIASGLLDNIAMLAPLGSLSGDHPFSLRSAYISSTLSMKEPLFIDRNSVVFSRDARLLPQWICYDSLIRKTHRDGTPIAVMKSITPVDPAWLGSLASGSTLLELGAPLPTPLPSYDTDKDAILCSVKTKFGLHGWEIPPKKVNMRDALHSSEAKQSMHFMHDDTFLWFARFLFEGRIIPELKGIDEMMNDTPAVITRRVQVKKVAMLVSALASADVHSASALRKYWAEVNDKYLFPQLKSWVRADRAAEAKDIWIRAVKTNVAKWKQESRRSKAK